MMGKNLIEIAREILKAYYNNPIQVKRIVNANRIEVTQSGDKEAIMFFEKLQHLMLELDDYKKRKRKISFLEVGINNMDVDTLLMLESSLSAGEINEDDFAKLVVNLTDAEMIKTIAKNTNTDNSYSDNAIALACGYCHAYETGNADNLAQKMCLNYGKNYNSVRTKLSKYKGYTKTNLHLLTTDTNKKKDRLRQMEDAIKILTEFKKTKARAALRKDLTVLKN